MATTPTREPLQQATIVAAGIDIADESGVESLSMRNLAERLGYKPMALYNHVANKDELLGLMADAVAAEMDLPDTDLEPLAAVRAVAIAQRAALVSHPWAATAWQQFLPRAERIAVMERLLTEFDSSDLPPDLAHHGFHAVTNHVIGYTLQELEMVNLLKADAVPGEVIESFLATMSPETSPHMIAHVHQHLDGDTASSFELVLDLILDGLTRLTNP